MLECFPNRNKMRQRNKKSFLLIWKFKQKISTEFLGLEAIQFYKSFKDYRLTENLALIFCEWIS